MLSAIRTFRNTDVAALCKVWNAHFGDLGSECRINPLQLELVCLSKPYFVAEDMLIAEHDQQVVGFLQLGPVPSDDLTDARKDALAIVALCIVPCDGEDSVARALLASAEKLLKERHVGLCRFKPLLPGCAYFQGFGPADSMIGATTSERRSCSWVSAAGFKPALPTTQWELQLGSFQPPVDRQQIQIRRSSQVEREADEPQLPWWQACLLGHTEPVRFNLFDRPQATLICEALFWTVAMELQAAPRSVAWLWTPNVSPGEMAGQQLLYLLGESCRELQAERIDIVRSVSAASDTKVNGLLRRLGFLAEQSGVVFEKKLA